jgi:hypothetical protein
MKTVSIGFTREDGDFAILATFNNNDEHINGESFDTIVQGVRTYIEAQVGHKVSALERQDTPDYVAI